MIHQESSQGQSDTMTFVKMNTQGVFQEPVGQGRVDARAGDGGGEVGGQCPDRGAHGNDSQAIPLPSRSSPFGSCSGPPCARKNACASACVVKSAQSRSASSVGTG